MDSIKTITTGAATLRFVVTSMNERQQVTGAKYGRGGGPAASFTYDSYGFPTRTTTGAVQDYSYNFDYTKGNLNWRKNNKNSLQEDFTYDNLDRLTKVQRSGIPDFNMGYDNQKGNVTTKDDVGTLQYSISGKPYSLSGINPSTPLTPDSTQIITYNSLSKISGISENGYSASFLYKADGERAKMVVTQGGSHLETRWYPTNSFMKDSVSGTSKSYTYIGGDAYSAPVVAVTDGSGTNYHYILRDYLGNITHILNDAYTIEAEYSYDAWGRMRNPTNWTNFDPGSEPVLFSGRGFTSHEHLPWFNLINMNGRAYDPLVGQFLSPDPIIQDPSFTQNYNRYSYCFNNPLKWSDPSGNKVSLEFQPGEDQSAFWSSVGANCAYWSSAGGSAGIYAPEVGSEGAAYINAVRNGYHGTQDEFEHGIYHETISLGQGKPTVEIRMDFSSNNYLNQKGTIEIRVYGSQYDEYNFVQSFYDNWDALNSPATNTWIVEREFGNKGFYNTESDQDYYNKPHFLQGAKGYMRDTPNGTNFNAIVTVCGRKGDIWYDVGTFSWSYNVYNGRAQGWSS